MDGCSYLPILNTQHPTSQSSRMNTKHEANNIRRIPPYQAAHATSQPYHTQHAVTDTPRDTSRASHPFYKGRNQHR